MENTKPTCIYNPRENNQKDEDLDHSGISC